MTVLQRIDTNYSDDGDAYSNPIASGTMPANTVYAEVGVWATATSGDNWSSFHIFASGADLGYNNNGYSIFVRSSNGHVFSVNETWNHYRTPFPQSEATQVKLGIYIQRDAGNGFPANTVHWYVDRVLVRSSASAINFTGGTWYIAPFNGSDSTFDYIQFEDAAPDATPPPPPPVTQMGVAQSAFGFNVVVSDDAIVASGHNPTIHADAPVAAGNNPTISADAFVVPAYTPEPVVRAAADSAPASDAATRRSLPIHRNAADTVVGINDVPTTRFVGLIRRTGFDSVPTPTDAATSALKASAPKPAPTHRTLERRTNTEPTMMTVGDRGDYWATDVVISMPRPIARPVLIELGAGYGFTTGGLAHNVTEAEVEEVFLAPFFMPNDDLVGV